MGVKITIGKNKRNKKAEKKTKRKSKTKKETAKVEITKTKKSSMSQLRHDLVTDDWVVIATGRGKRPDDFVIKEDGKKAVFDTKKCLFCDPDASGQKPDVLIYNTSSGDWSLRVFPNKYPAFARPLGGKLHHKEEGPYFWMDGVGYHEVIVTRDHKKHIGLMDPLRVAEVLDAYQTRYIELMNKKSVRYVEIFHNHGKQAGASISHPHSQLAAIPIISPYISQEINGAEHYYDANHNCVYCMILEWEMEHRKRIVYENDHFIVLCPFASRAAFETWIIPKLHKPYFERSSDEEKISGGEALHEAIRRTSNALNSPPFNFYLHTSPCDGKDYHFYHWHIEVIPRTSTWAGFELSTGVEISAIEPERAAKFLRKSK